MTNSLAFFFDSLNSIHPMWTFKPCVGNCFITTKMDNNSILHMAVDTSDNTITSATQLNMVTGEVIKTFNEIDAQTKIDENSNPIYYQTQIGELTYQFDTFELKAYVYQVIENKSSEVSDDVLSKQKVMLLFDISNADAFTFIISMLGEEQGHVNEHKFIYSPVCYVNSF